MNATIPNRTLYIHDNLDILRGMNSESIDLIATDPPFNKGRDFHATPDSLAAGARFQDRWSWEADVYPEWVDGIKDDQPALYELIDLVRTQKRDDLAAFLCWVGRAGDRDAPRSEADGFALPALRPYGIALH